MAYSPEELINICRNLIIDNNINQVTPAKVRAVIEAVISSLDQQNAGSVSAVPPLVYDSFTNTFSIINTSLNTIGIGETLLFKNPVNNNPDNKYVLEINDIGQRFVDSGVKIEGVYLGGDPNLYENWRVQTEIEP